jgi:hypothetical protein
MFYHPINGLLVNKYIPHWTSLYYHPVSGIVIEKKYKKGKN